MPLPEKQFFKQFSRSSLRLEQFPEEEQESLRYMIQDWKEAGVASIYETTEEVQFDIPEFLSILASTGRLTLSRVAFREEIMLFLPASLSPQAEREFYSIRVLSPVPFNPSPALTRLLFDRFPLALANNAEIGYIVHHNLFSLLNDEESLATLLAHYFAECQRVEFKTVDVSQRKSILLEIDLTD